MKLPILFLALLYSSISLAQYNYSLTKNIDSSMRKRVNFWKKVYTEITSKQAFIHDRDSVTFIYKKIDIPHKGHKKRARYSKSKLKEVQSTLRSIVRKKRLNLNKEERRLSKILKSKSLKEISKMAKRIRYQYGLKDNYYIGLKRSYKYLDYIQGVFKEYNIPKELSYLPHVESSFNYQAYSKVGAAGIWQFMRATARGYNLKITYAIDERRDVFKATRAAARLLKFNHSKIKVWPLAITAYNHGLASMHRAVKKLNTTNISEIIKLYEGRRFGFASQNFYATFLATAEISGNPGKYFPRFKKPAPLKYSSVKLPRELTVEQIRRTLKLSTKVIKEFNPAIRSTAYRSPLFLPRNFELRFPKKNKDSLKNIVSLLKNAKFKSSDLKFAGHHKIRRGDSLYSLSKIYRVSVEDLIRFNRIANPSKIFPGMKIKIPSTKEISKKGSQLKPEIVKGSKVTSAKTVLSTLVNGKKEEATSEEQKEYKTSEAATKLVNLKGLNLDLLNIGGSVYELRVEAEETIGHYSDWSNQKSQSVRDLNTMKTRSYLSLGQKLKIKLSNKNFKDFTTSRAEYHLSIQEDFYENFRVIGEKSYKVRKGDSINRILRDYRVPYWLFKQTQRESFSFTKSLSVGQIIKIPKVSAIK